MEKRIETERGLPQGPTVQEKLKELFKRGSRRFKEIEAGMFPFVAPNLVEPLNIPERFQPVRLIIPLQQISLSEDGRIQISPGEPLSPQPKGEKTPLMALTASQLLSLVNHDSFPFHQWEDLDSRAFNYERELYQAEKETIDLATGLKRRKPHRKAPYVFLTLRGERGQEVVAKCVVLGGFSFPGRQPVNLNSAKITDKLIEALGYGLEEVLPSQITVEITKIQAPPLPLDFFQFL